MARRILERCLNAGPRPQRLVANAGRLGGHLGYDLESVYSLTAHLLSICPVVLK